MQVITWVIAGCAVFFVVYTVLKAIEFKQKIQPKGIYSIMKHTQQKRNIDVEIKSKDLYMKAENLIDMHEVYAKQAEQLSKEIDLVEEKIEEEMISPIRSEISMRFLVNKSLKLQEEKCKIEAKIIKIMQDLDKIAKEELRRQVVRAGR